jgi:hypothetical protein
VTLQAVAPAHANRAVYTDGESLVRGTWSQNGTLAESAGGGYEGSKQYKFQYSFSNWWAGFGLNLTDWAGDGKGYDFTGYSALKLACSLTGNATVSITLIDADQSTSTGNVTVSGTTGSYAVFTLPLSSFTGMVLNDVGEIMVNISGNSSSGSGTFAIDEIVLVPQSQTGIDETRAGVGGFALSQNYPNPFNPATTISYSVPRAGTVSLKIYDLLGREIAVLVDGYSRAGEFTVQYNAGKLSSGIYFYRLSAGGYTAVKKMAVMK